MALATPIVIAGFGYGVVLIGAFALGAIVESRGGPSTSVGSNDSDAECDSACDQLQRRREEFCEAKADREGAAETARSAKRRFDAAVEAAALATGVAFVASGTILVPIIDGLSAPLAAMAIAAAGALIVAASYFLGRLVVAESKLEKASSIEAKARTARREATSIVRDRCPPEEAQACLDRPLGC